MSRPIPPALFALRSWCIKQDAEKFYVAPAAACGEKAKWSKGYSSLQAACAAVARKLAEEWTERNARRRKFHGLKRSV